MDILLKSKSISLRWIFGGIYEHAFFARWQANKAPPMCFLSEHATVELSLCLVLPIRESQS